MKFTCQKNELEKNLALLSNIIPSRPEPLVLGNVLLEANETTQKITITAFNGCIGIRTSFTANITEAGIITLPARLFNDIVSRLPEIEITLTCDNSQNHSNLVATLSTTSSKLQINGMDAEEFPELPVVSTENTIDLPITSFVEGLKNSLFAASTELSKEILTGVHISSKNTTTLEFAATDAHRLSVVQIFLDNSEESKSSQIELPEFAVTIPTKALKELEKMLKDEAEPQQTFRLRYDDTQIVFEGNSRTLTTLKLIGQYPPYESLIPSTFAHSLICDRQELIKSLNLVSVIGYKHNISKLNINHKEQRITLS